MKNNWRKGHAPYGKDDWAIGLFFMIAIPIVATFEYITKFFSWVWSFFS